MTATVMAIVRSTAAVLPLTLLALSLAFVVVVAVLWPTPARQAMVGHLSRAIKDLGTVIVVSGESHQK